MNTGICTCCMCAYLNSVYSVTVAMGKCVFNGRNVCLVAEMYVLKMEVFWHIPDRLTF